MTKTTQSRRKSTGRFAMAVVDGRPRNELSWRSGQVVLTEEKLVVGDPSGSYRIDLEEITQIGGRADVNQAVASVADYVAVHRDDDVLLIEAEEITDLEYELYTALIDGEHVTVGHPAVTGGVVNDIEWADARCSIGRDEVALAQNDGKLVTITLAEVVSVETDRRDIDGRATSTVEIIHTEGEVTVTTAVTATGRVLRLLASYINGRSPTTAAGIDLSSTEEAILLAVYAGVNQFRLPEFLEMEVDRVAKHHERLIEAGVLESVRVRREVALTPRGRRLAFEAASKR